MTKKILLPIILTISTLLIFSSCVNSDKALFKKQRAISGVGEAHMAKGSFSSALKKFLEAEKMYPDDHILQDNLGKVYVAKGKYQIAIKHFKRALEISPDFAPGKNNLGSAYLLAGEWDAAIEVFKDLNTDLLYGTPHYPMYNLGWAYYQKKDYKKATIYFKKALKLKRGYVEALRGLGLAYEKQNNLKLATKYLKKASLKAPKFQQLRFELANVFSLRKQYKKAIKTYTEVMMIKPDSELADLAQEQIDLLKSKM